MSPTKGQLSLDETINEIVEYLFEHDKHHYRLVIGTDSQEKIVDNDKITNFVTAIVIHRVGHGGRYFWQNGLHTKTHSLRDKIYQETTLSLDLAQTLVPSLRQKLNGSNNWDLEIHIDVGKTGKTRNMIKEVVGMVTGNGYKAKTKPDSFAASKVADKHT